MNIFILLAALVAGAEEWPVLWPKIPPVIQVRVEDQSSEDVDHSNADVTVHSLVDVGGNTVRIELEKMPPKDLLVRIDGPRHAWPHNGCLMCLGNHLISSHGQSANHLRSITYDQWQILHDNLHNGKGEFVGVKGSNEGWIGYGSGGGSYRRGPIMRLLFGE